jgi:hypothetical protein
VKVQNIPPFNVVSSFHFILSLFLFPFFRHKCFCDQAPTPKLEVLKTGATDLKSNSSTNKLLQNNSSLNPSDGKLEAMMTTTAEIRTNSMMCGAFQEKVPSQALHRRSSSSDKMNNSSSTERTAETVRCSNVPCFCLDVQKIRLKGRQLTDLQEVEEDDNLSAAAERLCTCCPLMLQKMCDNREQKCACFTMNRPKVKGYITNCTVVHETHRVDTPKSYLKK